MLMPSVSRAAHTTTAVDFRAEGIKEPVIGEKIPTETQLMVVDPNSFEPVKGKTYWMVEEADTWKPTNGGVFEGGKRYRNHRYPSRNNRKRQDGKNWRAVIGNIVWKTVSV